MSSESSRSLWLGLIERQADLLRDRGYEELGVSSEADFRKAFETICKSYKEKWSTRHLANLLGSHSHITAFASAVDATAQLTAPNNLTALFWTIAYTAIESGCRAGLQFVELIKLLVALNACLPHLGANIPRYPHDPDVQGSLQDIVMEYTNSYIHLISCTADGPPDLDAKRQSIQKRINEAASNLRQAKSGYDDMLMKAEQNELTERMERHRIQPNGAPVEHLNPNETRTRFAFRRKLGMGSFGEVSEVVEMTTQQVFARKQIIYRPGASAATLDRIQKEVENEVSIGYKLRHQHIASVLFFVKEPEAYSILMLPVGDCDLLHFMEERCIAQGFPQAAMKCIFPWFGCLTDALAFAHRQQVKHRDIKPSNILIKDGQPYLADFGVAKDFALDDTSASGDYFVKGTPVYRAPESVPDNPYSRPADIFALGCVFAEMLTVGKRKTLENFRAYRQAPGHRDGAFAFRANLPKVQTWLASFVPRQGGRDEMTELLVDQISDMLKHNATERPSAQDSVRNLKREPALFCASH